MRRRETPQPTPEQAQKQPQPLYKRVITLASTYLNALVNYQAETPPDPNAAYFDDASKSSTGR